MAKTKAVSKYQTLDECREGLRQLGLIQAQIKTAEATADEVKLRAERHLAETAAPLRKEQADIEADLYLYYDAHAGEIEAGGKKSVEFPGVGSMGRRISHSLKTVKKVTWDAVVTRLKAAGLASLVRAGKETVNKEAVRAAKLEAAKLAELGMQMATEQEWWYELAESSTEAS